MKITYQKAVEIIKLYKKSDTSWENPADFGMKPPTKGKAPFPLGSSDKVIFVDASKTGQNVVGPTEWRGVSVTNASKTAPLTIETETVYKSGLHAIGHNNAAEFIAIVDALRLYEVYEWEMVYSDSKTAISWVQKKRTNVDLKIRKSFSRDFLARLEEAECWLNSIC
jgi:ribonuclease HI